MKKTILLLLISLGFQLTHAQTRDPIAAKLDYVPGKVIVKLKDEVQTNITYGRSGVGTTETDIAALLGLNTEVVSTTVMFTEKAITESLARKQARSVDPRIPNPKSLKNIFVLELEDKQAPVSVRVEQLQQNNMVEYAEPDYNFSVNDFTINSDIIYPTTNANAEAFTSTPNDPLFSQQTNITTTQIDAVWENHTTETRNQIIAILDTGVDYTHPDLEANTWRNESEINGVPNFDDDGNGFIDDFYGWDFINLDNEPLDDNMHGTHVAGIAGAVGNNGIGIAGAAWNAKLMPIKVFQSNGVGNSSTIAEGVSYAANNGATILNMSFGTYAESLTLKIALENAYASSVLVAAAGNNGVCIGPGAGCAPFYPAAYTFVLGVEDSPKPLSGYTNFDQDGPIFSRYADLLNYELTAPGTNIMNTVPNGGYRSLTGTSMASPLVAGAIALYQEENPDDSKELLFGNLINTSNTYVDILAAINATPTPQLQITSTIATDSVSGQNANGFFEPDEIIALMPLVKNYWGPTDDVRVGIAFAEFEDQTKASILEDEIAIGSISAYATLQDLTQSLKIKIAEHVANNVNIRFTLSVWSGPNQDYLTSTEYIITVKNAILLYGVITEDLTLYADKEYLVSDNLILSNSATLIIKPGVTLKISDDKRINLFDNARIQAIGTKDSIITFMAENNYWKGIAFSSNNTNPSVLEFTTYQNIYATYIFDYPRNVTVNHSLIRSNYGNAAYYALTESQFFFANNIYNNILDNLVVWEEGWNIAPLAYHNNYINNRPLYQNDRFEGINLYKTSETSRNPDHQNIHVFNNPINFTASGNGTVFPIHAYLGTGDPNKYRDGVLDALNSDNTGLFNTDSISPTPYPENHAIVWKVLVNSKDAQDEYQEMDPIGVGAHTFEVYFNREMDTNFPPQISYGVREPYNQKMISETGTWSADAKTYTVIHELKIGIADGINRIRVQGARDLDYFYIPVEDTRFNMLVQSAGSASAGFAATPGLGEVALDWEEPSADLLTDILGYNMYRYQALTDSTFTEPQQINQSLITNPAFVDFNVEESQNYFYKYKILRTSFEETDYSKTVASRPLTSLLGDSNGDFEVNVMDLVHDVDYILGNNPTPFIFSAADVNTDNTINVLDIVGTVDIILNPSSGRIATRGSSSLNYYSNIPVNDAIFYWEGNDLYVESVAPITGMQLAFDTDFNYSLAASLARFETLLYQQDGQEVSMFYTFNNQQLPAGKTKLLTKQTNTDVIFNISKAVVATTQGLPLQAIYENRTVSDIAAPEQGNTPKVFVLAPNPTAGLLNVSYYLPEKTESVRMYAYDLQGKLVWQQNNFKNTSGQTNAGVNISSLSNGIYIFVIDVVQGGQINLREVNRIIVNK